MEYPEDDEPEPVVEQVLEANAAIPNIPVPRSSDGKVSWPHISPSVFQGHILEFLTLSVGCCALPYWASI